MRNVNITSMADGAASIKQSSPSVQATKDDSRISAEKLFGHFTASVIKEKVKFTR